MRMPKMQVYLPEELHARVKRYGSAVNVSGILQAALMEAIANLERREALAEALSEFEANHGEVSEQRIEQRRLADQAAALRPKHSDRLKRKTTSQRKRRKAA